MKVKITKENLIKAIRSADIEFALAIVDEIFDKLPTKILREIVVNEVSDNFWPYESYEVTNKRTGYVIRFLTRKEVEEYLLSSKLVTSTYRLNDIINGAEAKNVSVRTLPPNHNECTKV